MTGLYLLRTHGKVEITARTTVGCPTGKGRSLAGRQLLNLLVSNITNILRRDTVLYYLEPNDSQEPQCGCHVLMKSKTFCLLLIDLLEDCK